MNIYAQLVPLNGDPPITLADDVTIVGRQEGVCDIVIDKKSISKVHCILARTDGLIFVRDVGSTNGTKVNGQKIIRGALLPNDEITFASERFRVHLGPNPAGVQRPGPNDHTQALSAGDYRLSEDD